LFGHSQHQLQITNTTFNLSFFLSFSTSQPSNVLGTFSTLSLLLLISLQSFSPLSFFSRFVPSLIVFATACYVFDEKLEWFCTTFGLVLCKFYCSLLVFKLGACVSYILLSLLNIVNQFSFLDFYPFLYWLLHIFVALIPTFIYHCITATKGLSFLCQLQVHANYTPSKISSMSIMLIVTFLVATC